MKFLFVLARYPKNDYRSQIFEEIISPRNQEFCDIHGLEYLEIGNDTPLSLFRGNPTWWKFTVPRDLIKEGKLKPGDTLIHYDADIYNVRPEVSLESKKSFCYAVDSGNTACMGFYSMKVNDWSCQLLDNILDEQRFQRLSQEMTVHSRTQMVSCFVQDFREQCVVHRLFGIPRHSEQNYLLAPHFGWHSEKTDECVYSLEELHENVSVWPVPYNTTCWPGESSLEYSINPLPKKEDVVLRHMTGANWNCVENWIN